jgi:hypothetical protein
MPLELMCTLPQLLAWIVGLEFRIQGIAKLTRVARLGSLLSYFSQRQEDLSVDVRWIAACKFIFILFSTAHWVGCALFYLAAETGTDASCSTLSCSDNTLQGVHNSLLF